MRHDIGRLLTVAMYVALTCGAAVSLQAGGPPAPISGEALKQAYPQHIERIEAKATALGVALEYDFAPELIRRTSPMYPAVSRQARTQGTVLVLFAIDDKGRVTDAEALESIPVLDEAALSCVREWRFEPAQTDGEPVGTLAAVALRFVIG